MASAVFGRPVSYWHLHSRDIFRNLATERVIFKRLASQENTAENRPKDIVLTYINEPCVVLGRFQNAWHEVILSNIICCLILTK